VRQIAEDAHEMGTSSLVEAQMNRVLILSLIGVLRDTASFPKEALANIFTFAAAFIDQTPRRDTAEGQTLDAARESLARMAGEIGFQIPPVGEAKLVYRT
jgi:hypothetical protein